MATKTLKVPNKLSEITLGQYQQFSKIMTDDVDQDFLQKKTIEIFCGVDIKDVDSFKYSSILEVIKIINKMFDQKPELTQRFKYNENEFGFIPDLSEMSFGEYVDLDTLMGDWETMDQAMGVLYRKIENKHKKDYTIVGYDVTKIQDMSSMPLDVAFGAIFFLENLRKQLCNHILNSLQMQTKMISMDQKRQLQKLMVGGSVFIPFHKAV